MLWNNYWHLDSTINLEQTLLKHIFTVLCEMQHIASQTLNIIMPQVDCHI